MHRKGAVFYYVTLQAGKRVWTRLGDNYADALAAYAQVEGARAGAKTVGDALDRYTLEELPKKAPKTRDEYRRQMKRLRAVFGDVKLDDIRPMHVARYLDEHPAKVAANREASLLSGVYKKAMRWGWTDKNPVVGITRNTEKGRERYLEDAELLALREAASDQLRCIIDLAYLTAMRKSDMLNLQLADLTDEGIRVRQGKTGKSQLFEWTPALKEVIERAKKLRRRVGAVYLFATRDGQPYTKVRQTKKAKERGLAGATTDGFDSIWARLKERAGVPDCHFHDLRAKALTDAKDKGGIDYAQLLAGHASVTTTEVYTNRRKVARVIPLK